ncbi:MAG: hypothetical protein HQ521_02215 [Bacteroidetes bacterium]|nr:hypothetical protein [Bacteroidota bacterium]
MEIKIAIIGAVGGLISGAVLSLIAPWVKWGIEKKKLRYEKRVKLINEIKSYIEADEFDRRDFVTTSNYSIIRCHLKEEVVKELEKPYNISAVQMGGTLFDLKRKFILEDLARISDKWKIT